MHEHRSLIVPGTTGADIQAAIDAVEPGDLVVLPPGEYRVSRTIELPDRVTVQGAGSGRTTIVLEPGANCHVFTNRDHARGNRALALRGLSIRGTGEAQQRPPGSSVLTFACGVYLKKVSAVEIRDVTVEDVRQTGLQFNECAGVRVDEFACTTAGWSGIATSGTDDIVVTRARVSDAGRDVIHSGIHFDGGTGVVVEADVADCTGNGIMLDSAYCALDKCVVDATCTTSKRGLSLSGSADHPLTNVVVRGSFCRNREVGILISNAAHVFVARAVVEDNPEVGIRLQGRRGARDCIVASVAFARNGTDLEELHASGDNYLPLDEPRERGHPARTADAARPAAPAPVAPGYVPATHTPDAPVSDAFDGRCFVCGREGTFELRGRSIRESYRCPACSASLRYQGQAKLLVERLAREGSRSIAELVREDAFRSLDIFEPGVLGPFRKYLRDLPSYVMSDYWPDVAEGAWRDGVQCQNLMRLTFPDESFDLVVTSDIFEHVRRPFAGFEEIRRVLRPGGLHVFSIPVQHPMPAATVARVDVSGDEDVPLLPPRHHLGPGGSRHIVYNDFGRDLLDELAARGLSTTAVQFDPASPQLGRLLTFCSVRTEPAKPGAEASERAEPGIAPPRR